MSHKRIIWTIVVLGVLGVLSSKISAQSVGISMGSHLISDKFIFQDKAYSWYPRPFTFVGLNYSTKQVTMSITYTFDAHIVSISSQIPLWSLRKKDTWALINNRN